MKTKIISTLKKELLIVEAKDEKIAWAIIFQKYGVKAVSDYTLLGTPDEIKEEDVSDFVKQSIFTSLYGHYVSGIDVNTYCYKTALQSFNSALESEIFWDFNPLKYWFENADKIDDENEAIAKKQFEEAQEKTFDKKRTLIFTKNERQDN